MLFDEIILKQSETHEHQHAMETISTRFGELRKTEFRELCSTPKADGFLVSARNTLSTPYGELVPLFETEDLGRRSAKPVTFYKDGPIRSVPLQTQTMITTPVGTIPAELVSFHPSGALKKVFPLDGSLSGFWSWQNELGLASELEIETPAGKISAKIISLNFYESGSLKSLTFWPGQQVSVSTPYGQLEIRKGVSFYENGSLRSFEPSKKTSLPTPIGLMVAYDNEPNGIHGDTNSVELDQEGLVTALSTIDNEVGVIFPDGNEVIFKPGIKNNVCGDERKISTPMKLQFRESSVMINQSAPFPLRQYRFRVRHHIRNTGEPSYSCTG
jgi:hypothetical protein